MSNEPYIPSSPAAQTFVDSAVRGSQFLPRISALASFLAALAGLLETFAMSNRDNPHAVFMAAAIDYLSELASNLTIECAAWATLRHTLDDQPSHEKGS